MEFEEVVTMDLEGSSAGVDDDGERSNFRQLAWLLREKLNGLVDGDQGKPPELKLRSLLNLAASRKIISVDPKMLNPVLWRTLPKELLILVWARLPVPDIIGLYSLSREWKKDMATVNSGINQACDEASPSMVAILSSSGTNGSRSGFFVTICDLSKHRSPYSYTFSMRNPYRFENAWETMGAIDGGLVCFVSTWKPNEANPLCIVVMNLLTRDEHELPPLHYLYYVPPAMVHIKVDSETKCYKVVVVGKHVKGRPTVEIYDSGTKEWTRAAPPCGSIFGLAYTWKCTYGKNFTRSTSTTQSVYDFAERQLKLCGEKGPSRGVSVMDYELQNDCMFVLRTNISDGEILPLQGYCITKYRIQNNAKDWVQERSYLCSPFEAHLKQDSRFWTLKACEGFLVIKYSPFFRVYFWLLDLSTGEWSSLPNFFEGHEYGASMSRAFWNVVP